jgi:hypothetical protein
LAKEE